MPDRKNILCAFVMQGCPYCRDVPKLMKSASDLAPAHLVDSQDELAQRAGISSFPTLYLVSPLFTFAYAGPREPEALRTWMRRKMYLMEQFEKTLRA